MNTSEKIAELIQRGWTQVSISDETGIPQATISRIASRKDNNHRASNAYAIDRLYEREINDKSAA